MKATLLPTSTETTAKYGLIEGDKSAILVIDQNDKPVYTNPTVTVTLPKPFKGPQAIDMFLLIMTIQETKYEKMVARIGKKPK